MSKKITDQQLKADLLLTATSLKPNKTIHGALVQMTKLLRNFHSYLMTSKADLAKEVAKVLKAKAPIKAPSVKRSISSLRPAAKVARRK